MTCFHGDNDWEGPIFRGESSLGNATSSIMFYQFLRFCFLVCRCMHYIFYICFFFSAAPSTMDQQKLGWTCYLEGNHVNLILKLFGTDSRARILRQKWRPFASDWAWEPGQHSLDRWPYILRSLSTGGGRHQSNCGKNDVGKGKSKQQHLGKCSPFYFYLSDCYFPSFTTIIVFVFNYQVFFCTVSRYLYTFQLSKASDFEP